jgi:hypothetical protein
LNNLLTPALSSEERENLSPRPVITLHPGITPRWIRKTVIRNYHAALPLFPLPGGEGQGEGERQNQFHVRDFDDMTIPGE